MPQIQKGVDLFSHNTFKVHAQASYFTTVNSVTEITNVLAEYSGKIPILVLGEGANVLFTKDYPGLVILNKLQGRQIMSGDDKSLTIEVAAGENWHDFVMWSVENDLSGIENLALIPGTVGAAPVGNIAAYGQNVGEAIVAVNGIDIETGNSETLRYEACKFYYRDSIFKHRLKNKFFVTSVVFKLWKISRFDTNYQDRGRATRESLAGELAKFATPPYTPADVAEAVIRIRKFKMPDWHVLGTAGSFFKNPFVTKEKFAQLKKQMPDVQPYPINAMLYPNPDDPVFKLSDQVKIPAGRLLDELGWKGKRIGNVGTFERHALVVVNYGGATGQEILEFTRKMAEDIKRNFEIDLEPEVNII